MRQDGNLILKSILIVINNLSRAGAERVLVSLLKLIDYTEYSIDLLSIIDLGELFDELPKEVNVLNPDPKNFSVLSRQGTRYIAKTVVKNMLSRGYGFYYIPYAVKNLFYQLKRKKFLFDKFFWKCLSDNQKTVKKEYDLAVGFTEGAATYYVSKRVKAKKKISYIHVDYEKAGYIKELDKKFYESIDSIFCVSNSVKDGFLKIYPEHNSKTVIFDNIVLPDEIRSNAKKGTGFTDSFDGVRLLTVARLHPQKAFEVAIPAFAKLVSMGYDNVKWYVMGEGEERKHLESLIEKHGLKDKFILCGMTDNPYPYIKQCDIYVHATHYEGWCIAIAEALILKKPVIASNVTGNRDQITNEENGLIIDLSVDNLAEAIKRLIDDKALRQRFIDKLSENDADYLKGFKMFLEAAE